MTDQLRQAAQQALELSAVTVDSFGVQKATQAAIAALRTALEQQAEPVAWNAGVAPMWPQQKEGETFSVSYTTTPQQQPVFDCPRCGHVCSQRPWQGLTPDEVKHLYPYGRSIWGKETFEAIEKALKDKNT